MLPKKPEQEESARVLSSQMHPSRKVEILLLRLAEGAQAGELCSLKKGVVR